MCCVFAIHHLDLGNDPGKFCVQACQGDSVVMKAEEPDSEGWYLSSPLTSGASDYKLHSPHDSVSPSVKWKW